MDFYEWISMQSIKKKTMWYRQASNFGPYINLILFIEGFAITVSKHVLQKNKENKISRKTLVLQISDLFIFGT